MSFGCDTQFPSLQATPLRRPGHINWPRNHASGFSSLALNVTTSLLPLVRWAKRRRSRPAFALLRCQVPASSSFPRQGSPIIPSLLPPQRGLIADNHAEKSITRLGSPSSARVPSPVVLVPHSSDVISLPPAPSSGREPQA